MVTDNSVTVVVAIKTGTIIYLTVLKGFSAHWWNSISNDSLCSASYVIVTGPLVTVIQSLFICLFSICLSKKKTLQ